MGLHSRVFSLIFSKRWCFLLRVSASVCHHCCISGKATRRIYCIYRIIIAIGEHIGTEEGLAGTAIGVGVYESGDSGVIIAGLEVIEASLIIVVITPIADWVHMGNVIRVSLQGKDCAGRAFYRSHFTPGVILVGGDQGGIVGLGRAIIVASVDRHYITLDRKSVV